MYLKLYHFNVTIRTVRYTPPQGVLDNNAGENVLREMIKVKNADKIGEFSLTDGRLSRITKFMAETLFDENRGGRHGNVHTDIVSTFDRVVTAKLASGIKRVIYKNGRFTL